MAIDINININNQNKHWLLVIFGKIKGFIISIWSFVVKCLKGIGGFIKKIWKIFVGLLVLAFVVGCAIWGYDAYQEQAYQKQVNRLEHKLNNFSNPDSVFIVSDYVLRHSIVFFKDSKKIKIPSYSYKSIAIENMKKLAEKGNANAQFTLGLYYSGLDFEDGKWYDKEHFFDDRIDQDKSAYWYLQAAKQGHCGAMNNLGYKYQYGQGVNVDLEKALYWFRKSAQDENDDGYGALNLGDFFKEGIRIKIGSHKKKVNEYYMGYWVGEHYKTVPEYKNVLTANIDSAMYYWKIADKRGCPYAKERLQKIYE